MKVIKKIIEIKGIPKAIYTDRAGWTSGGKRDHFSQFARACEELGIKLIFANSPEAKGRIERAFKTIQDRIIPELRLNNISEFKEANQYLQNQFLKDYWNIKNKVEPYNDEYLYSKVPKHVDLNQIFCIETYRKINMED